MRAWPRAMLTSPQQERHPPLRHVLVCCVSQQGFARAETQEIYFAYSLPGMALSQGRDSRTQLPISV